MLVHKSQLKVLFWNARSVLNKIYQLYSYLDDNCIDICCICETHLKPNIHLPSHPDYVNYRFDRTETTMGGVMIMIHRDLKHTDIPILRTNLIENIGIEIIINRRRMQFYSCYLPGGFRTNDINQHLANDITTITRRNTSYFALGDFNATHRSWNCSQNNKVCITHR